MPGRWARQHRFDALRQRERDRRRLVDDLVGIRRETPPGRRHTVFTVDYPIYLQNQHGEWVDVYPTSTGGATTGITLTTASGTWGSTSNESWWQPRTRWSVTSGYEWLSSSGTWIPEQDAVIRLANNHLATRHDVVPPRPDMEQFNRVHREVRQRFAEAQARASALLDSILTAEQRAEFAQDRKVTVIGGLTGLTYEVRMGRQHNIVVVGPDGRPEWDMCVHVRPSIPDADNVAAQVLGLQMNERLMIDTANFSRMRMGEEASHRYPPEALNRALGDRAGLLSRQLV